MIVLGIETSCDETAAAVVDGGRKVLASIVASQDDVDAFAVTHGPGLVGSLLIGCSAAKAIAYARRRPLVAVNHLEGHIYAAFLEGEPPTFPFLALVVSGGHT